VEVGGGAEVSEETKLLDIIATQEARIAELDKECRAAMENLNERDAVADMSQCTCTTDKEATCIVHPTTRSLKEYIAKLVAIRDAADRVLVNTNKMFSEHRELKELMEADDGNP